jgi:diaminopimelate epimerase
LEFVKGHGTENDFVLLPDRNGSLDLTAELARRLCDRRAGIGADGVIRVAPASTSDGLFFMDYRNADGSLAEMCGNGARVFAALLYDLAWVPPGPFTFLTRGGLRRAERTGDGEISVAMGPATVGATAPVRVRFTDGSSRDFAGVSVDVGNPHLVALTDVGLERFDLSVAPQFDQEQFPHGANVEFVTVRSDRAVAMRVFERGVGETRSCGTGTVAAAAAHLSSLGIREGYVQVAVPGGAVRVDIEPGASVLTGPAVIVASGRIDARWWRP